MNTTEARGRQRRQARIRDVARETLGYDRLRPGQAEAIDSVLQGNDTLVVLATGQGKSAIYQLAGMQLEGPSIVVSPLLALQRDQVASILEQPRLGGAAALNSETSAGDREQIFEDLASGALEFVFLAPEQLANSDVLQRLAAVEPSLFVVDEAHCISDWGHDFRPAYLRLGPVIDALGGPVILAMTATASPPIRQEIVRALGMESPAVIVRDFDRPNIRLEVIDVLDEAEKRTRLLETLHQRTGSGIVYVATRADSEGVAAFLCEEGIEAVAYHAGLNSSFREEVEARFLGGEVRIVVATIAFGMGIDKPDIRFVIHFDISGSLDAYYQEVGRAGRDGLSSEALLYYCPEDLGMRKFFGAVPQLDEAELLHVLKGLGKRASAGDDELPAARYRAAINLFVRANVLEVDVNGDPVAAPAARGRAAAIAAALEVQERRTQFERTRLEMVRSYAETRECRRSFLLSYFGDTHEPVCGNCDRCAMAASDPPAGWETRDATALMPLFTEGERVRHKQFGEGRVLRCRDGKIRVLFDDAGYRTLAIDLLAEGDVVRVGN